MTRRPRGRPATGDAEIITDDAILEAVLWAFGENGFDGTSIREIARRLGISHNLIPQRFGSKTDLWYAAVKHGFRHMDRELVLEGERLGDDQLAILRGLLVRVIELNALNPSLLRIINAEASQPGPRLDYIIRKFVGPAHDFLENWVSDLAARGLIRKPPTGLIYFLINHGAGSLFVFPGLASKLTGDRRKLTPATIRAQAEQIVSVFLEGLLPR
ncbi:MAG: TetR/AcrR family transcriptional regulator [Parvibaculum sp.]